MGSTQSSLPCLQILRVKENSLAHKNNILPFMHYIYQINNQSISSPEEAKRLLSEWEDELVLKLFDVREEEEFDITLKKTGNQSLGISVKLHENKPILLALKVMEVQNEQLKDKLIEDVDFIIGIENCYLEEEDRFFKRLYQERGQTVVLLVFNEVSRTIRRVEVVPGDDELLGCSVGSGILHSIPHEKMDIKMDYTENNPQLDEIRKMVRENKKENEDAVDEAVELKKEDVISEKKDNVEMNVDTKSEENAIEVDSKKEDTKEEIPTDILDTKNKKVEEYEKESEIKEEKQKNKEIEQNQQNKEEDKHSIKNNNEIKNKEISDAETKKDKDMEKHKMIPEPNNKINEVKTAKNKPVDSSLKKSTIPLPKPQNQPIPNSNENNIIESKKVSDTLHSEKLKNTDKINKEQKTITPQSKSEYEDKDIIQSSKDNVKYEGKNNIKSPELTERSSLIDLLSSPQVENDEEMLGDDKNNTNVKPEENNIKSPESIERSNLANLLSDPQIENDDEEFDLGEKEEIENNISDEDKIGINTTTENLKTVKEKDVDNKEKIKTPSKEISSDHNDVQHLEREVNNLNITKPEPKKENKEDDLIKNNNNKIIESQNKVDIPDDNIKSRENLISLLNATPPIMKNKDLKIKNDNKILLTLEKNKSENNFSTESLSDPGKEEEIDLNDVYLKIRKSNSDDCNSIDIEKKRDAKELPEDFF
ncbi:hypothetical protein SLOPH_1847 [Spraguea lophii 42_110]|uniref:PDZ GRASP-type domain-containing protein n=1 Tax=Spraguea lophii (strain 42_110) TaxID=1358809 RepID=S7W9Q7_SPRLO|nr:hypothetical protein SLOPH_1847 [Spraguea lophii 42_110]